MKINTAAIGNFTLKYGDIIIITMMCLMSYIIIELANTFYSKGDYSYIFCYFLLAMFWLKDVVVDGTSESLLAMTLNHIFVSKDYVDLSLPVNEPNVIEKIVEVEREITYQSFAAEEHLKDFLYRNPNELSKLIGEIGTVLKEHRTKAGPIDLFTYGKNGTPYVIELKNKRTSDRVVGQTLRYMGAIQERTGKKPLGIIITPSYDSNLEYAASQCKNIMVLTYGMHVDFFDHKK